MSAGRKRKPDPDNLEQENTHQQKRANKYCEDEVKKARDDLEVKLQVKDPKERELYPRLYKFEVFAVLNTCMICEIDISRSARVI